jgi:signal peptidase
LPRVARAVERAVSITALTTLVGMLGLLALSRVAGYQTLVVQSASMTGTADVGSFVVVRLVAPADVAVGDVILMTRQRDGMNLTPVLHRVIERYVDGGQILVRTKGDAVTTADPEPYILSSTTATPVLVVPKLGYVLNTLQTPLGLSGLILGGAALMLVKVLRRARTGPDDAGSPTPATTFTSSDA